MMIGVGIEHALAGGWSIRGDLEHYRFRASDFEIFPIAFDGVRPRINIARLSTVIRF